MKNLIVFFRGEYKKKHGNNAFFDIPQEVKDGFLDFFKEFKNDSINIYICRGDNSYKGNGEFKMGFKLKDNDFVLEKKVIKSNFIFNRSSFYIKEGFNNNGLIDFCKSKDNIIKALPKYSTKTYFIDNKTKLKEYILKFSKKAIKIIKPSNGSGGKNVIISKSNKKINKYNHFPCLLQKYINTSSGIPNIYKGIHDLRIIIVNGKIVHSMYRTPGNKKYICNTSKGGSYNDLNIKLLGKKVKELCKKVDNLLVEYDSRYYSIDMGYTKEGLRIFELNSSPLLREKKYGTKRLHKQLHKLIINKFVI